MGLFGRIGGFFRRAVDFVGRAASVVQKGLDFIQKPLNVLTKPLSGMVGKVLDKLPFGLGNVLKPLADKFLNNALSFLAPGGMGLLGALTKAVPSLSKLNDIAKTVGDVVGGIQKFTNPEARANIVETFAKSQAEKLLAGVTQ